MPRSTRYLQNGFIYHLTHRCHNGRFFLRFSKERDRYRECLRVGVRRYQVAVLGYAITSNHVHVIVDVEDRYAVAVGSDEFIEEAVRTIVHRRSMEKHEIQIPDQESTWIVREPPAAYKADFRQKNNF